MTQASPLNKRTVLITRPVGREKNLSQHIEQAGGRAVHYPVIQITPPATQQIEQLTALSAQLQHFTMAIFISPTAVEQSLIYFPDLPEHLTIVSMGSRTTQTLNYFNVHIDVEAAEHNTESLLLSA